MTPHILFAAYQTDRGSNGGMESATRIFEALAGAFRWTLMTNRETPRTERWRAGGARVVQFGFDDGAGRLRRALQLGGLGGLLLREVARSRPDVMHANDVRAAQVTSRLAPLTKRPWIYTVRDTKAPGESYSPIWGRIARHADRIVTLSDEMGQFMQDRFAASAQRLVTISSIVDLETFRPLDPKDRARLRFGLGIGPDEQAVGIVAGVIEKKGQLEFLQQAMPALLARHPRLGLHLIGDHRPESESYARACQQAAERLSPNGRVRFHGFVAPVHPWLQALDCVVVASRNEGLARCMIESMACATPVVSFEVCSAREMLEATGAGRVVPFGDFVSLAEAVSNLLGNVAQASLMGRKGREAAETRFHEDVIARKWQRLYTDTGALKAAGSIA